jgi:hypothetical protein
VADAWPREEGVTCVVCPACAFTFDAGHTDVDGGGHSCPACAELALGRALEALERLAAGDRTPYVLYQTSAPLHYRVEVVARRALARLPGQAGERELRVAREAALLALVAQPWSMDPAGGG